MRPDLPRVDLGAFHGLNTKAPPRTLRRSESPDCLNVDVDGGVVTTSPGVTKLYTTGFASQPIRGAWTYRAGATNYVLAHCGTELWRYDGSTTSKLSGATSLGTVNTEGAVYGGKTYYTNTTLGYYKWDGTTFAAATGPGENMKYILQWSNRIVLFGGATNASLVWVSAVDGPETWTTAGGAWTGHIGKGDGDEAMGIISLPGMVLMFKRRSLYYLSGSTKDDYYLDKIANVPGTVSARTIQVVDGKVYWLADDGVWRFGDKAEHISDRIKPTIDSIQASQLTNACAGGLQHEYHLWVSTTGTTNNKRLVFDTKTGGWTLHDSPHHPSVSFVYPVSSVDTLCTGSADSTGLCFKEDVGTSHNGTAIDAYWTTPIIAFPGVSRVVAAELTFTAKTGAVVAVVDWRLDDKTVWSSVRPVSIMQPDAGRVTRTLPIDRLCSAIQLRVRNQQKDESFVLHDITLRYDPKGVSSWRS
jgi:hypothetical protein